MTETTALVVGGGATGVGVARDLAMRGVDTTLVEREGLAAGTSGRSHGVLHSGARYAESDPDGAGECIRENETLRDIAGEAVAETGGLFVSLAGDDPDYFEEKREACTSVGIDAEELTPAEARRAVPGLTEDVEHALRVPDAVVYPSRLVAATAASARDHGAEIRTHSPLRDLHVKDGRVVRAVLGGDGPDTIDPEFVVNAAGAWAGECAALAGLDVSMRPTRGVMVGVDCPDLSAVLNRCRPPADGDIAVPHGEQAVLGTTSVAIDDPDDYEHADWEVDRTIEECAAMLPALAGSDPRRTYWGVRPLYEPDEARRNAEAEGATGESRGISRDFALLDHTTEGVENAATIVGGKLTTHRLMAEATADHVCAALGIDADCRTAEEALPGAGDAATLDRFVREFDAGSPADADVVGAE
jgi:glycerol-3-phosphate dehydrogenase